jgi:DNA topoisomerase I
VRGASLKLTFRGKGGKQHSIGLRDKRLARVIRACQDLPGQRLLQYEDEDDELQRVDSDDVNDYQRDVMGEEFSAKDFRTWAGTVLAVGELSSMGEANNKKAAVNEAVKEVAAQLGNTPAVCRKCYIHPGIVAAYENGLLADAARRPISTVRGLRADEVLALNVLKRGAAAAKRVSASARQGSRRSPTRRAA